MPVSIKSLNRHCVSRITSPCPQRSACRVRLCEEGKTPGKTVVAPTSIGIKALIEVAHITRADGEGLVGAVAEHLPVADILGPGCTAESDVAGPSKGLCLGICERLPRPCDVG